MGDNSWTKKKQKYSHTQMLDVSQIKNKKVKERERKEKERQVIKWTCYTFALQTMIVVSGSWIPLKVHLDSQFVKSLDIYKWAS